MLAPDQPWAWKHDVSARVVMQEPKFVKDAMTRNLEWFDRYVLGKAP